MLWLIAALMIAIPIPSLAQEEYLGQIQVPQALNDLFNTFQKIDIDFSKIPIVNKVFGEFGQAVQNPEQIGSDLPGFLDGTNQWFQTNVGVGLGEIAKSIGDFIVWVLESIVKLVKAGIAAVSS